MMPTVVEPVPIVVEADPASPKNILSSPTSKLLRLRRSDTQTFTEVGDKNPTAEN